MAVIQITSREFREKQASMFALADKEEQVVIRRRGKVSYMLPPFTKRILSFPRSSKRDAGNTGRAMRPAPQKRNLTDSWIHYEPVHD